MTDRGRSEVYAAELMAFDGTDLEEVQPFEVASECGRRVTESAWWSGASVSFRRARSDARTSTTRWTTPSSAEIALAPPQCTPATVVHELAHALAGPAAGHGGRFRRAHVDVAAQVFGLEPARWLEHAYRSAGLDLGARSWPEPSASGGPIAL